MSDLPDAIPINRAAMNEENKALPCLYEIFQPMLFVTVNKYRVVKCHMLHKKREIVSLFLVSCSLLT